MQYKVATMLVTILISLNGFSQQAWTRVPSPNPSTTRNILSGISGTSSADVWAVGHYTSDADGAIRNYIIHWDGTGWQLSAGTDLGYNYNDLWDVAAITADDVWAAGTYNEPGTSRSQLLHWNGTAWSHTILPSIPGGSFLFSIDAMSTNDIWAVGGQAGSPTKPAYAIHYNGLSWTEYPAPNVGSYSNWFESVDGIAPNDVWAVGRKSDSYGDFHAMVQHWDGNSWANFSLPPAVASPIGVMERVTMIASNDVWALGSTVTGGLLMIHWNGISWTEVPTAGSAGGAIIARGADVFGVGDRISQWNGNSWSVIEPLSQLPYPSLVSAVSFSNGDIWTAGRTSDANFNSLVYRTANTVPQFIHGNSQALNIAPASPYNIDEMLKVQDADMKQVVIYDLITPPLHGTVTGLPDTAITNGGVAMPSGITYQPAAGYTSSDQFIVQASVGPLLSQTTINVNVLTALPVLISNYSIDKRGSIVKMQWSTLSELNAMKFVMERGMDGINFTSINHIAAYNSAHNYELVDPTPLPGRNFYRLLLIDKDNRQTIFPVKSVNFEKNELAAFVVLVNPVTDKKMNLRLNAEGSFTLCLYNQSGQQVMNRVISGPVASIQVNLPGTLASGLYSLLLVKDNRNVLTEKIFIR